MSTQSLKSATPKIHRLLARLRRGIRWYVLLISLATGMIWIVMMLWLLLGLDYLPIRFGFQELSRPVRTIGLVVVGGGLSWILWKQILRRIFVPLNDESLALLVERKYPQFEESLVTSVSHLQRQHAQQREFSNDGTKSELGSTAMGQMTLARAESLLHLVRTDQLLESGRLRWRLAIASGLAISLVVFGWLKPDIAQLAASRLLGLSATAWPRECELELVGIKVARQNPVAGIDEMGMTLVPQNGKFKIARGAAITILTRAAFAETTDQQLNNAEPVLKDESRRLPELCRFSYQQASSGTHGTLSMNRIGTPREGFQLYSIDGQPLDAVANDLTFYIYGGDDRVGPFDVNVVDPPTVISTKLDCVFPEYLVDVKSMRWTPREQIWAGPTSLPTGTQVTIRSATNKRLTRVYALDPSTQMMESFDVSGQQFEIPLPVLRESTVREIYLVDTDGIVSEAPFVISLEPSVDQPPTVEVALKGIGSAITPNARIPFAGKVDDDYAVANAWLEIEVPSFAPFEEPVSFRSNGGIESELDFLKKQRDGDEKFDLPTEPGSIVSLIVKASDRYNLTPVPQIGFGDKYVLEVVDDGQLLRILERQEVGERRRLEQIYSEMTEAQTYIVRTREATTKRKLAAEPGESLADDQFDQTDPVQLLEIRLLFAQRTQMQVAKSRQEIRGIADSFENIRLQLTNNRIDSADRQQRLSEQVEKPLREISGPMMEGLNDQLLELDEVLRALQAPTDAASLREEASDKSILIEQQLLAVQTKLNAVLDALVKYETQNELLEIVRGMIKEQEAILEQTKKKRQEDAFEGLLD